MRVRSYLRKSTKIKITTFKPVKEQAAIDLLSDQELYELAEKLCNCPDDLIQEVVLLLLEMPEEKWQQINEGGYLRFYVVRTMMTMATSKRSSFSKLYDLHNHKKVDHEREDYDWEKEDDIALLETLMDELHWYDREVLKLWLEEGSYRKVGKKVDIPYKSIGNTVNKALEQLRDNYYAIHLERIIRERCRLPLD